MYISNVQTNTFPEKGSIYDFSFEKVASGQWIDWMETIGKGEQLAPTAKVLTTV